MTEDERELLLEVAKLVNGEQRDAEARALLSGLIEGVERAREAQRASTLLIRFSIR